MKKLIIAVILTVLTVFSACFEASAVSTSAHSAVLIDGNRGNIVYEKNAHERMGMASTTKIMTAIVAIENCPLERSVSVADAAIGVEGSSIYLKKGESLTMEQLLYALLLQSANDAATAIAIEVGGSVDGFAELMNEKADELGLTDTHFTNPHGLSDEQHYTTSYDLALITKYALQNPIFRKIVSTYKTTIPSLDGTRVLVNHNKLLKLYDGTVGVKTGFTKKTGRCLVSAAEKEGTLLVGVTLNAPDDWNDHIRMLDHGFDTIKTYHLAEPSSISFRVPVVGGVASYVDVSNVGGLTYTCQKQNANIDEQLILDRFLFAPIEQGDIIGQIIYYNNGEEIGRLDLIAQNSVMQKTVKKKKLFGLF
ncbi:MAG: D-alanyl-D-alanine carboxypeptidase [Ruminococcaceae bacterium]|nr:D-alanyl-D-alanine carboxypeptidase [Oscillospiraceae bacterium]